MTTQTQQKKSRDYIWGEIMLCLEILALLAGIESMDIQQFFENPNEIFSKYFVNKLSQAMGCISKKFASQKEKVENKLHELIASMDRNEYMSNEPISAEAFFAYHRSELRPLYYQAIHDHKWK